MSIEIDKLIERLRLIPTQPNELRGKQYKRQNVGLQAQTYALIILEMTVGRNHPVYNQVNGLDPNTIFINMPFQTDVILAMHEDGLLVDMRSKIIGEVGSDLLDNSQDQILKAKTAESNEKIHLGLAAFMTGAVLEESLRQLCDKNGITYDHGSSSLSKLNIKLYQGGSGVITKQEMKNITTWGETRNTADHGRFEDLEETDVKSMIDGVRTFNDKYMT